MNIEELRTFCLGLPSVTEDIKWGDNLVFSVAGKMFCLADLEPPLRVSFKVPGEEFAELTSTPDIIQAPYFARNMWVLVKDENRLTTKEWEYYLRQSYELVKSKLSKKIREELDQDSEN
jgi:predicted DNA-binding protein (MmcQ/YjbR family)